MSDYDSNFRMDRQLSAGLLNQDACEVSGGRLGMMNGQIGQYIPFQNACGRQLRAGVELEYAKAVWDVRIDADEDVIIEDITSKYGVDQDKIKTDAYNTIYITSRGVDTKKVYITELPYYLSHHSTWGYTLVRTELFNLLRVGYLVTGEEKILAHGPSRKPNGDFAFGYEANCSYLGTFGTNEDGVEAAMEVKKIYQTELYSTTVIPIEANNVLLNKFGDDDYYKPIPSVGDRLNAKGLIAVKRETRKAYGLNNMSKRALRHTNRPFDLEIYGMPNSEVIEVEVIKGPRAMTDDMPSGMVGYLDSLYNNRLAHLKKFMDFDRRARALATTASDPMQRRDDYLRHPLTQVRMVAAERELTSASSFGKSKPSVIINEGVCSGYNIRIITRKINIPQLGHKYTGLSAEKFVISVFKPNEDMPTDKWGRYSLFNANPVGVVNRNNPSQLCQQYTTDACFHTRRKMLEMQDAGASWGELWDYLVGFYNVVSPTSYKLATENVDISERPAHIMYCLLNRIDLEDEIGDEHLGINVVDRLFNSEYRPPYDVVTFRDNNGTMRISRYKCRVSNKYVFAMEKIGKHASASSIPLRQNCGFAAKHSSKQTKVSQLSTAPKRVYGEAEFRGIVANGGPLLAKRLLTLLSNPRASKMMASEALAHLGFMNIEELEYRSLGMNMLGHLLQCFGFGLEYIEETIDECHVLTEQELGDTL